MDIQEQNRRLLKTIYTCFPEGKHKVLTMSYDDGRTYDRRAMRFRAIHIRIPQ